MLPQILCSMRCTPVHATGCPQAEIMLGRKLLFPFEVDNMVHEDIGTINTKLLCFAKKSFNICVEFLRQYILIMGVKMRLMRVMLLKEVTCYYT